MNIKTKTLLDSLGITGATLSRWKNDINEPDDATKLLLAKELDTSVSWLVGEIDDPAPLTSAIGEFSPVIETPRTEQLVIALLAQSYSVLKATSNNLNHGEKSAVKGLLNACLCELSDNGENPKEST